jgi:hypothetical protein
MSAAANAAGYLYAHRLMHGAAQPAPKNVAPRAAPRPPENQEQPRPRAPRIEYRKRRVCVMPEAA